MTRLPPGSPQSRVGTRAVRALACFVGAGVFLYLIAIFWTGWELTLEGLSRLGVGALVIGALVASTSYLWRFFRWEMTLRLYGYELPRFRHLGVYLAGLALTTTPGKSGETFRSVLLLRDGVRLPHSLAAFVVDRATDVLGMCLLGGIAAAATGHGLSWAWVLAFSGLLGISCGMALVLRQSIASRKWAGLGSRIRWLPVRGGQQMIESWAAVWRLPRLLGFSVIALFAYGTQALVFAWFCALAGTGVSVADCVLIFVQATLFGAATMLPGGLGAMEAALVLQLTEHGVDSALAISLAISIRLVTLWVALSLGALSLLLAVHPSAAADDYPVPDSTAPQPGTRNPAQ